MAKPKLSELSCGVVTLGLAVVGLILFLVSYTTGYYTFGEMNSGLITLLAAAGIVATIAAIVVRKRFPDKLWASFATFAVTALLAAAAILILGDRVEGIGNCIVTDYDSGHGGEEAIYLSLGGAVMMLVGVVFNIVGSFAKDEVPAADEAPRGFAKSLSIPTLVLGAVALAATLFPTLSLAGVFGGSGSGGAGGSGNTYTVSYNIGNGNAESIPDYQFLGGNLAGMVQADSRLFVDEQLVLNGDGTYNLFAETYVIESGKRAEIGDDTGLGLVWTMNAEGTYEDNGDGTVTTSAAEHAVLVVGTDTYSEQMKAPTGFAINGSSDDGTYDSAEIAEVLEFVPATTWELADGAIVTYYDAEGGAPADTAEPGDGQDGSEDAGEGYLVTSVDGATTILFRADGTFTFAFDQYGIAEDGTWTFDGTTLTVTNEVGEFTSEGNPLQLHYVSVASDQLVGDFEVDPAQLAALLTGGSEGSDDSGDSYKVASVDGATAIEFRADGTCTFAFDEYGIAEDGTWTFDGTTLTVTNEVGEFTSEGNPLQLHYVSVASDQLVGDFEVDPAKLPQAGYKVASVDGATAIEFRADGTCTFTFDEYGIAEDGTWTFDGTTLVVTNDAGENSATGSPLALHYVSVASDQLVGDFEVDPAQLP